MSMSMADGGQELQRPEGYPSGEEIEASTSNSESSSTQNWRFLGTYNDLSLLESGLLQRDMDEFVCGINCNGFQEKLGKVPLMDPRLVSVLEYFRELFVQKREVFMNIFPELLQQEVVKLLEKFETVIAQVKMDRMNARVMQRSLSIDSPRPMSLGGDRDSPSKLDYFKIRTVYTDGGAPQGDDQQGTQGTQGK